VPTAADCFGPARAVADEHAETQDDCEMTSGPIARTGDANGADTGEQAWAAQAIKAAATIPVWSDATIPTRAGVRQIGR
jgi:hypothetical protein